MDTSSASWISHQVSEFLARVSAYSDERSALRGAIEHAGEALEAEVVAVARTSDVLLSIGLNDDHAADELAAAADAGLSSVVIESLGTCRLAVADLEDGFGTRLVVARAGEDRFDPDEQSLVINMGRTLGLVVRMLRTLAAERAARQHLIERQRLMDRLGKVRASISHRAPLQDVLDAVTEGLRDVLGDESTAIRFVDPDDPRYLVLESSSGFDAATQHRLRRVPVDSGAAGRAIRERRLIVMENYPAASDAIPELSASLRSAMAAPLFSEGTVVGALVTATTRENRVYTDIEQEALEALSESASIALTDAKTLESMREAQRAKDTFLTMVSHELKTPLTVIMGSLQTLRARLPQLSDNLREDLLVSALRRGDDLHRLIDMLLQSTRVELAGSSKEVSLFKLVAETIHAFDTCRPIRVAPTPDTAIVVDSSAVHQILSLLLENAVAHSPEGTEIEVACGTTASQVSMSIRNHGSLPADMDVKTLFTRFERGPEARSSGTGMGLYIASSLAASIDGRIDVAQHAGLVDFTLVFPAVPAPSSTTPALS